MREIVKTAVIGGSGVYEIEGVDIVDEKRIETPFGPPSDIVTIGEVSGNLVAFLPRHGKGHRMTPTELPVKANLWALKSLGVENVIAVSAVGSLKEEYAPGDFVVPSQIIDRTKLRDQSFFSDGIAGHVSFADPFCPQLSEIVLGAIASEREGNVFSGATYLCMEGPAFSTRAESHLYRSWGCGVIGMTAIPEAKLAREAEMAYAMIAMVTDYDCWRENTEEVSVASVLEIMGKNTKRVKTLLPRVIERIPQNFKSDAHQAAKYAIITKPESISKEARQRLELLYSKYWD